VTLTFRPKHRLTHKREFDAVHAAKMRTPVGPLVVYSRRNGLPHPRLGLSIARAFGSAPERNRLKRCVREAFRLMQQEIPPAASDRGSFDLVITARRHDPTLESCRERLAEAVRRLDEAWRKREAKEAAGT